MGIYAEGSSLLAGKWGIGKNKRSLEFSLGIELGSFRYLSYPGARQQGKSVQ